MPIVYKNCFVVWLRLNEVTNGLECVGWVAVRKERARIGEELERILNQCVVLAVILGVLGKDTIQCYR